MKRWMFQAKPTEDLAKEFPQFSPLLLQLLANRGLSTRAEVEQFLRPSFDEHVHDPFLFRMMERAVDRLRRAIKEKEHIRLFGDYDVDGVSALAILFATLRDLAVDKVSVAIPDRYKDGYGLNEAAVRSAASDGVKLLLTCDCGTSNVQEVALAAELGIDVIIVDHHQQPQSLPDAYAMLNPALLYENYPWKKLCSGGVAFKLAVALLRREDYGKARLPKPLPHGWEKWLLDLVALATVADMMPLLGENRTLVKHGVTVLRKTRRVGLQALATVMDTPIEKVSAGSIGFQIAPRLNAAGRLKNARTAFDLLTTTNPERAAVLAAELQRTNQERQRLTETVFQEALGQLDGRIASKLLVAHGKGWSSGVIGLVAGKLKELFHRPVLAIGEEGGKLVGSGRSVAGFDITKALGESRKFLLKFGGHSMACGFTVLSPDHLEGFLASMSTIADRELSGDDLQPMLNVDAEISLNDITWALQEILDQLQPYGSAVPEPVFASRGLKVLQSEHVGRDGKHLRLRFVDPAQRVGRAIGFGWGEWAERLQTGELVDLAYHVAVNEWNGNRELQLTIVDIQPSS